LHAFFLFALQLEGPLDAKQWHVVSEEKYQCPNQHTSRWYAVFWGQIEASKLGEESRRGPSTDVYFAPFLGYVYNKNKNTGFRQRPLLWFRTYSLNELDLGTEGSANKLPTSITNLFFGDRSQFAWDSNFASNGRDNLLSRHRETRSEPIADLVRDNFNHGHARVVLIALVDAIT
jgi:hypothetical protein